MRIETRFFLGMVRRAHRIPGCRRMYTESHPKNLGTGQKPVRLDGLLQCRHAEP